jgi:hypothetical protein
MWSAKKYFNNIWRIHFFVYFCITQAYHLITETDPTFNQIPKIRLKLSYRQCGNIMLIINRIHFPCIQLIIVVPVIL